ncbi:MAG: TonB-dependent receptor [Acidobacteriota bacterium]|nr:TonB-dependent receptor [Acidobacteriota bacterium]
MPDRTRARILTAALLAALLTLPATSFAQNVSSHLTGTVKDGQGAVLPGVTVTATSPALIGSQVAVTQSNGSYLFPSLPSGTYTLKFELSGFQTLTRSGINLPLGQTLTVNGQLQLASLKESVTVTAESPVVDTQSTSLGNTLNTAKLIGVPTSTDLWGALAQTAGVRMQGFDVGGSHKYQQDGYDAFGETSQNRVITEGVDTTEGTGGAGFYQDYYSQNEVAVSAAGQDVSMNTPGAAVISTIKSGGNTFKSLLNQTYEPSSFVGNNIDPSITARGGSSSANLLFWESHADLGGPIKKDKAWFFAAYNHFHIDQLLPGVPKSVATNLGVFNNFTTKETWKPSSKDTIIGYYQYGKKGEPTRGLSALRPPESTLAEYAPSWMYNGKWERVWTNRLFTELNIGEFGYHFPEVPSVDYKTNPPIHDLGTGRDSGAGFAQGGTGGPFELNRAKPQAFGDATYYLPTKKSGSHDLKVGFEWIRDESQFGNIGTAGPILWLQNNGQPAEIRLTDLGTSSSLGSSWLAPVNEDHRIAIYAQDRWTANAHVTVTAGVRYDHQSPYYRQGKRDPILTDFFSAYSVPARTLFTRNNVAPRIGVAIDPGGDGKTAIKAFFGRYYFNYADSFSGINPGGTNTKTYTYTGQAGITDQNYILSHIGTLVASTGGVSTVLDTSLKTPYTDEIDFSVQRQVWGESSIRVAYVRKMNRDQFATYNQSWLGQFTNPVIVPVTIQSINGGVTGSQTFTVNDVPSSLKGVIHNVISTMPASVNNGAYNFDTIEVAFNKRFKQGLFLDTSYDWTRSDSLKGPGNYSASSTTQGDAIGNGFFINPYPTVSNRQVTTGWVYHLSAHYELPYAIGVGANFLVQSGWNYSPIIRVSLPNSGTQSFWMTDLQNNRSDTVPMLNLRLDKAFNIPSDHRFTVMLDLYNLTNAAPITNFQILNGKTYNQVINMLNPRTMELGLRFEF